MSNPYENAAGNVSIFLRESNLLHVVDVLGPKNQLVSWALDELIIEVSKEISHEGTKLYNHAAYMGEMHDVLVFVYSELIRLGKVKDVEFGSVFSTNGAGKRSDVYEKLIEQLLVLMDDKSPKAFEQFLKIFYSALKYSPGGGHFLETFINTMMKVLENRHPLLYSTYCPILRRELNEEECLLKHAHLEKMTGYLRKKVLGRDLKYTDWSLEHRPDIYWLMVDWMLSDWAFQQLKGICEAEKNGGVSIRMLGNGTHPQREHRVISRPSNEQIVLFAGAQ